MALEERRKLALTEAAEDLMRRWPARGPVAMVGPEPYLAFIADDSALISGEAAARLRMAILTAAVRAGMHAAVREPSGARLLGDAEPPGDAILAVREIEDTAGPWRLEVWPADLAALSAGFERRERLFFAMLVVVAASLVFGTLLTASTVSKQVELARMKADFVSAVSHEFRTPLTGISHLIEMLERGRVPNEERRTEYYRMIAGETRRLTRLVENVMDFARIEDGRKSYSFEALEPAKWLRDIVADFRNSPAGRAATVEAAIPETLPQISADRDALTRSLFNLLDNAAKYSAPGSTVHVQAEVSGGTLTVRVRDEGIGIPDAERKRIFERFFRGSSEAVHRTSGTGLGLSLVRDTVTAHGGSVTVDTRVGEGSTFCLHLPLAKQA
jgi:signal transduction histidine kinase